MTWLQKRKLKQIIKSIYGGWQRWGKNKWWIILRLYGVDISSVIEQPNSTEKAQVRYRLDNHYPCFVSFYIYIYLF